MDGSAKTGIVVIGTTFVDIKGYPFGEYIPAGRNAGRVAEVHGGVSRNIAEDIANVGMPCTYVSTVDESGVGTAVVRRLAERGCNTAHIEVAPDGLGTWLAVFDHTGDVVASISKRPDMAGIARILDESGNEIFAAADSIAIEFDIDQEILEKTVALARAHEKRIFSPITNMTIALERRAWLRYVDCLVCNKQEAGILFCIDTDGMDPQEMEVFLTERVGELGLGRIVVTMGGEGSAFAQVDGVHGRCPAQPASIVDTTGAGDAFFAGVAAGLTYGATLAKACEIGTALATSCIEADENVCRRFSPAELGLPAR